MDAAGGESVTNVQIQVEATGEHIFFSVYLFGSPTDLRLYYHVLHIMLFYPVSCLTPV